jgi:hypothetical protein
VYHVEPSEAGRPAEWGRSPWCRKGVTGGVRTRLGQGTPAPGVLVYAVLAIGPSGKARLDTPVRSIVQT